MSALISAEELKNILRKPHVRLLDASYGLPPSPMGIAGAQDFDIDDVADPEAPLAHTIPSAELFAEKAASLGIGNDNLVIVYDRNGMSMAASRAWWMFRLFGHDNVKIIDGGLPAWIRSGGELEEKKHQHPPAPFKAVFRPELIKMLGEVQENISTSNFNLIDARDAGRFNGNSPEPRPHVASGHIPGSINVPFVSLLNADGTMKAKDQLEKSFSDANVPRTGKFACSCGSGVTACVVALALHELGHSDAAVYDGSWTEWGTNPTLPKVKGP